MFNAKSPVKGSAGLSFRLPSPSKPFAIHSPHNGMVNSMVFQFDDTKENYPSPAKNDKTLKIDPTMSPSALRLDTTTPRLLETPRLQGLFTPGGNINTAPLPSPSPRTQVELTKLAALVSSPKAKTGPVRRKRGTKGKKCSTPGCQSRAQSRGLCKNHGGGARCQYPGCTKSSQGGGRCRTHGGGQRCSVAGCTKGTQRNGLCYVHGGVQRCQRVGCMKKDRGNGFCISHGGGRRCTILGCSRPVRKGNACQLHAEEGSGNSPKNATIPNKAVWQTKI